MKFGTVDNCTFRNSYAGNGGALFFASGGNVTNFEFIKNEVPEEGGAIYSSGETFVDGCSFNENHADIGGAISLSEGNVNNSNFYYNLANTKGGAIFSDVFIDISDCSFTNHTTGYGGALYARIGSVKKSNFVSNAVIVNGGAIYFDSKGEVYESNFTDNHAMTSGGAIFSNILVSYLNNFTNNGTVEKIDDICSQRLFNVLACYLDGNAASSGDGSIAKPWKTLSEALQNHKRGESILVYSGIYSGANNTDLVISVNTGLFNYDGGEVIFDANSKNRIFTITNSRVNIGGITFKNGFSDEGGALYISESSVVQINGSTFMNNHAKYNGGAILASGYLLINNSLFWQNKQTEPDPNQAARTYGGGAITATFPSSTLFVSNSMFQLNSAADSAGALQIGSYAMIDDCIFNQNTAVAGGAIRTYVTSDLVFSNRGSKFYSIRASEQGGAMCLFFVNTPMYNLYFQGNSANFGGAVSGVYDMNPFYVDSPSVLHFCNCIFYHNMAFNDGTGGAIVYSVGYADFKPSSVLRLDGCTFKENVAVWGGAVYSIVEGESAIVKVTTNATFSGNVVVVIGEDIYTVKIADGYGDIAIPNLSAGSYRATVIFNKTDIFKGSVNSTDFNVTAKVVPPAIIPVDPGLTIAIANIVVGEKATIRITTNAAFSGTVTVKIGSKNYMVNVVNGAGTAMVSGLSVGTYTATATFAATAMFKASVKSTTFKVKAHVIKLALKKVKVKKSAKKLVIKATLKIDGKKAKGKKLKFKFKNKKYTAKTNKKGIAKITIKKKVLKKLKVGKKSHTK